MFLMNTVNVYTVSNRRTKVYQKLDLSQKVINSLTTRCGSVLDKLTDILMDELLDQTWLFPCTCQSFPQVPGDVGRYNKEYICLYISYSEKRFHCFRLSTGHDDLVGMNVFQGLSCYVVTTVSIKQHKCKVFLNIPILLIRMKLNVNIYIHVLSNRI